MQSLSATRYTEADLALNFVRQYELSEEELQARLGQEGSVIVAEKYCETIHGDEMLSKPAAVAVEERIALQEVRLSANACGANGRCGGYPKEVPGSAGSSACREAAGADTRTALVTSCVAFSSDVRSPCIHPHRKLVDSELVPQPCSLS